MATDSSLTAAQKRPTVSGPSLKDHGPGACLCYRPSSKIDIAGEAGRVYGSPHTRLVKACRRPRKLLQAYTAIELGLYKLGRLLVAFEDSVVFTILRFKV